MFKGFVGGIIVHEDFVDSEYLSLIILITEIINLYISKVSSMEKSARL